MDVFAETLVSTIWKTIPKMHLILDRTNWKFGNQDINYLVLAMRVGKLTFPLFFELLQHQGNSDTTTRIALLNRFKKVFGFQYILSLTADREFIGQDWFAYLLKNKIPFFIRIKQNQLVNFGDHKKKLKEFFEHLNCKETRHLYHMLDDPRLFIVGKKVGGEFLIILSNVRDEKRVLQTYRQRWDVERLFKNMKTQGFNLENTHMKDLSRLSKLMVLVTVSILLCAIVGLTMTCPFKKTVGSPLYSYFTRGIRTLKNQVLAFDFLQVFEQIQKSEG